MEGTNERLETQEPSKSYDNVSFQQPYLAEKVAQKLTDVEENETSMDAYKECYELNQVETGEDVAENHFTLEEEPLTIDKDKMKKEDDADFNKAENYVSDVS